jgi:hypothetical protein
MKLSVECRVEGIATMEETTSVVRGDTEFTFVRSESGTLASVRIVRPLAHPEKAFNIHTKDSQGRRGIKGDMDKETFDATIEDFKQLESMLAFSVEIHHIDWQSPTVSLIPRNTRGAGAGSIQQR